MDIKNLSEAKQLADGIAEIDRSLRGMKPMGNEINLYYMNSRRVPDGFTDFELLPTGTHTTLIKALEEMRKGFIDRLEKLGITSGVI